MSKIPIKLNNPLIFPFFWTFLEKTMSITGLSEERSDEVWPVMDTWRSEATTDRTPASVASLGRSPTNERSESHNNSPCEAKNEPRRKRACDERSEEPPERGFRGKLPPLLPKGVLSSEASWGVQRGEAPPWRHSAVVSVANRLECRPINSPERSEGGGSGAKPPQGA